MKVLALVCSCVFCFALELESISASFVQTGQGRRYEGNFIASAPNFAKWQYTLPFEKSVYLTPSSLIIYEPVLSQVIIKKREMGLDFIEIFKKAKQDPQNPSIYYSNINHVQYTIFLKDQIPQMIQYQDALEQTITIELKEVKLNPKIDPKVFEFVIPQGIDVIEE